MEWISVDERLPDHDRFVLVHRRANYREKTICAFRHARRGWLHVNGDEMAGHVISHWMPLPPPPDAEPTTTTEQAVDLEPGQTSVTVEIER